MVLDDTRCDDFTSWIDDTADSAFRPNQVPLPSARIDRLQMMTVVRPTCLVEVPPWNAVHRGDHRGIRSKQRLNQCCAFMGLVRFQGTNHEFLLSETGWAVSYTHLRAHETVLDLVCRLLLEKKKKKN